MKRLFFISLLMAILLPLTTSCEKDEVQTSEKSGNQNGQGGQNEGNNQDDSTSPIIVTVDANGNADGGHRFVKIDDTNFYIDDIKYTISSENLIVTGYEASFSGKAKIISQLNHEGREMYVIGIEEKAFEGCTDLTSVVIPSSVTSIGDRGFYGCTGLTSVHITDLAAWCKITFKSNPLSYAHHLYLKGQEIRGLVIPSSVTSIESKAFSGCTGLTSVTIPSSVTGIGDAAFEGCTGLTSVTIPDGVTFIGDYAFQNCTGLTSVTIPSSVTYIGWNAFSYCTSLTSAHIPLSVSYIGIDAFGGCTSLTSIIVEDGNPTYDSRNNCNAIIETESNTLIIGCKNSSIPSSVTRIGDLAFYGCKTLKNLTIPASVTSVGMGAFMDCTGLTSVHIPLSVSYIGIDAFWGCTSLTSITVEDGNPIYDSRSNCNAIIETVSNTLIVGCKRTTIPSSVTSIGEYAFYDCTGLTSVTIPSSVTSIGSGAFYNCTGLTHVYCYAGRVPSTKADAFEYSNIVNATLHVPTSAINAYRNTAPWSDFKTIVAIQ